MTQFIKIPQAPGVDFQAFKDDYLVTTGEKIQNTPIANEQDTHYLVGSSRLSQEDANALISRHHGITIAKTIPAGWKNRETLNA